MVQPSERKRVFQAIATLPPLLNRFDYATNHSLLWIAAPLEGPGRLANRSFVVSNVTYRKQSGRENTLSNVELRFVKELRISHSSELAANHNNGDDPNEIATALNAMITHAVTANSREGLIQTDANRFFLDSAWQQIGQLLRVYRGYFVSVRPGTDNILLNVNLKHAAFHNPYTVAAALQQFGRSSCGQPMEKLHALLKGLTVRIMYSRPRGDDSLDRNDEHNRKKTIVGFGLPPGIQQFVKDGKMTTVKQWFEQQGARLQHLGEPCVNVGLPPKGVQRTQEEQQTTNQPEADRSRELWIPAELLEIEPHQPFKRQLNDKHMEQMSSIACQPPAQNHGAIVEEGLPLFGIGNPQAPPSQILQQAFNLTLGTGLMEIPATAMALPTIGYKGKSVLSRDVGEGSWNLRGQTFFKTAFFEKLDVSDLRRGKVLPLAEAIAEQYLQVAKNHGLFKKAPNVSRDVFIQTPNCSKGTEEDALNELVKKRMSQTALVLMDAHSRWRYGVVKCVADRIGLATICLVQDKPRMPTLPQCSNLVMKHNIKLDPKNINHIVSSRDNKTSAFASLKLETLVVGVDVVHPGGVQPSIAAMVASIDGNYVNFPGSVSLQPPRQEILEPSNTRLMFNQRLTHWVKKGRPPPKRLLYYRDGVGEDQRMDVLNQEVSVMEACLKERFPNAKVPVTVIVVEKRHNTRFFVPGDNVQMSHSGNVKPGVIVDSHITLPKDQPGVKPSHQDFYLQSHVAVKGAARPAHYTILRNDTAAGLNVPELQRLSLAFCFNFQRSTTGVSYCAPAYYADRLCDRAHHYLKVLGMPPKSDAEKAAGRAGDDAYAIRARGLIANTTNWNLGGSGFPWAPRFQDVMFWL